MLGYLPMIEPTQILLIVVVIVLTSLTVIIGWQIFQILMEIRKMLSKFNLMADGAVNMTQSIGKSLHNLNGFSDGLKAAFGVFKVFKNNKSQGFVSGEKENDE